MRTFQFRLYPSKEQQEKLWKHANKLNELYNYFLNQRIENFKLGIKTTWLMQQAEIIQLIKVNQSLKEIHLYIVPKDGQFKKSKETKVGWLNSITGKFYENDTYKNSTNFIRVAFNNKELAGKPGLLTFNICPKCEKSHLNASDFYTKGNEPFYNLVSEQLMIQQHNIFEPERLLKFPNAGRKVLLFSDSRQRAAVLAKDLTRAADDDAVRKVLLVAIKKLQDWAKKNVSNTKIVGAIDKVVGKVGNFANGYVYKDGYRTSNTVDRPMNVLDRCLFHRQSFHGHLQTTENKLRAWAILYNFRPFCARTSKYKNKNQLSRAEQLNAHRYSNNWLQNMLVFASMNGFRHNHTIH